MSPRAEDWGLRGGAGDLASKLISALIGVLSSYGITIVAS